MSTGPRQAVLLMVAGAAIGFGANAAREEPLPLSGSLDPPAAEEPGADFVAGSAAEALTAWEQGTFFLDIRSREEYEELRVSGAFSFEADRFQDRYFEVLSSFGLELPLFVYGAGPDSHVVKRVAAELESLGHGQVGIAVCGLDGLLEAGLAEETGPAEGMP